MNELAEFCRSLKKDFTPKIKDPSKPVSCWSEKDILDKKIVDAFVIIFRTKGCSWAHHSGCTMCGYYNDSLWENISDEDIIRQFQKVMDKYNDQKIVKIFTSGSFLDDKEISLKNRRYILRKLFEKAEKVSVESRPEYISTEKLDDIKKITNSKRFEIGVGLETADEHIRKNFINKGFSFDDYKKSADLLKKYSFNLKTYVLVKPPFLSEKQSIDDSIDTIKKISKITDSISLNPCNIQRGTLVDYLWYRNEYRPPWLFSIVEILKQGKKVLNDKLLKCDIAGGGSIRGAHNCKKCDKKYLQKISDFSLTQNIDVIKDLSCSCKEKWLDHLDLEPLGFGSLIDM